MGYNPETDISTYDSYCMWYRQRNVSPDYRAWLKENNANSLDARFHRFDTPEDLTLFILKYRS